MDRGVTSRVVVEDAGVPGVTVRVDGDIAEATTTRRAVELLMGPRELHVDVEQAVGLPVSQGFGMSAAGALSAALAVAEALERPRAEAVWAAHCAEVFQRTGLGDVVGADVGGFEVRTRPGCAPYGLVQSWRPDAPVGVVLLAVVADTVSTKRVLTDPAHRADINRIGGQLVDAFQEQPTLAGFVDASRRFAQEARLASPEVLAAWDAVGPSARAGQCQLGGSVFVFGATSEVRRRLERLGSTYAVGIDAGGARVASPRRLLA